MPKDITIGLDARSQILQGAFKAARVITVTYGPLGRTALLQRMSGLLATKDGATVARELHLENRLENMGCQLLKEACFKVNDQAGDGTTTTALLTAAILREGHKYIVAGASPIQIVQDLKIAGTEAVKYIRSLAAPVKNQTELEHIALISCNGDREIAELMAKACMAVGQDGTIVIEDGQHVESKLEFKEGVEFDIYPVSRAFLKDQNERVLEGVLVAVIKSSLRQHGTVKDFLGVASQWPDNPLIVFALDIDGDALRTMVLNDAKNVIKSCAFNAPSFNDPVEFLKDIAALSGARLVDPILDDLEKWDSEWFGAFRHVSVKPQRTTITTYPDKQEFLDTRLQELRQAKEQCDSDFDKDKIAERMAKLSEGLAILKIGGVTEIARKERRARVEDVLGSTQAALKFGVVPGGGRAYHLASLTIDNPILKKALLQPTGTHAQWLRLSGTNIMESLPSDPWVGWDVLKNQVRDFREDPLIADPTYVVESAIRAAISIASILFTAEVGITRA